MLELRSLGLWPDNNCTLEDFKGTEPEIIERINKIAVRLVDLELLPLSMSDGFYDAANL